jgi:hypothetical protein
MGKGHAPMPVRWPLREAFPPRLGKSGSAKEGCIVVGEVAQAHDGSLGMAHAFIDAIAGAGADAVKFQTHIASAESTPGEPWRVKFSPQDATRYELHRVWVIEATEREGKRHAFGKRMFYVDEDSWNVVLVENHDPQGKPWRFQEGHLLNSYDIQSTNSFPIITYDLKENRYFAWRMLAEDPPLQFDLADIDDQEFLPAAVKRKYSK